MKKNLPVILFCFILTQSFGQAQQKISTYLLVQYNSTIHDYTKGNNPWGIGLGVQTFYNNKTKFKPTIELTGDIYLADDKVLRLNPDGSFPQKDNRVGTMVNLFAGLSFQPMQSVYLSLVAGPGFINGEILPGIKPSFGVYLSKNQRWTAKISYINMFNRTKLANEDFGSLSVAIGLKLF